MLEKTVSDVSSNPGWSPGRSPGRRAQSGPVYYVESPSPGRSHSRKTSASSHRTSSQAQPGQFDAIEEDEEEEFLLGGEEEDPPIPRRCLYALAFLLAFVLLFTFFSLVLWGASRAQKPIITMKSVRFEDYDVHAGTDSTGVATGMVTMNVTLKLLYRNRATFFGVHVAPTPVNLFYKQIIVATGAIDRFYQGRKSQRPITVHVTGTSVPVYGGGSDLTSKNGAPVLPLSLALDFRVRSRAYVLGRLVKPKFLRSIHCPIIMVSNKMHSTLSLKTNCTYL